MLLILNELVDGLKCQSWAGRMSWGHCGDGANKPNDDLTYLSWLLQSLPWPSFCRSFVVCQERICWHFEDPMSRLVSEEFYKRLKLFLYPNIMRALSVMLQEPSSLAFSAGDISKLHYASPCPLNAYSPSPQVNVKSRKCAITEPDINETNSASPGP